MTGAQLCAAIGVPVAYNAIMLTLSGAFINARIAASENAIDRRFDDMRELWRTELHRVEQALGARLKHIEEQRR